MSEYLGIVNPLDKQNLLDRLRKRIVTTTNGCWNVPRARSASLHYVQIEIRPGKRVVAHRVSYELLVGPVPDGLVLDHLCFNKLCCNPSHLEAVTFAENFRRSRARPLPPACSRGHAYSEWNTILSKTGRRSCRTCVGLTSRKSRMKLAELRGFARTYGPVAPSNATTRREQLLFVLGNKTKTTKRLAEELGVAFDVAHGRIRRMQAAGLVKIVGYVKNTPGRPETLWAAVCGFSAKQPPAIDRARPNHKDSKRGARA